MTRINVHSHEQQTETETETGTETRRKTNIATDKDSATAPSSKNVTGNHKKYSLVLQAK